MGKDDPPPDKTIDITTIEPTIDRDLQSLARDWITVWQSELAATAVNREAQETWQSLVGLWANGANALSAALPTGHERHATGPSAAARPAPAAAAPDARDAEVDRLARRVAELEHRLAQLERGGR